METQPLELFTHAGSFVLHHGHFPLCSRRGSEIDEVTDAFPPASNFSILSRSIILQSLVFSVKITENNHLQHDAAGEEVQMSTNTLWI